MVRFGNGIVVVFHARCPFGQGLSCSIAQIMFANTWHFSIYDEGVVLDAIIAHTLTDNQGRARTHSHTYKQTHTHAQAHTHFFEVEVMKKVWL